MRKTKIVCTIGPASESVDILEQLISNGMDVARLNFSHGDYEEHKQRIENIREAAKKMNKTVSILLDTQGPEIRTKTFKGGKAMLNRGDVVYICMKEIEGTAERFSVTYKGLIDDVEIGTRISLDDGLIELEVVAIDHEQEEIKTRVINSGKIKNKKGVNIPNVHVNLPSLTEKDKEDILFGIEQNVDFIAASFVREHTDVLTIKKLLEENDASHIQIIAKIENREGVDHFDKILEASYGIMIARGDLGVEIPAEEVPLVQKELIHKCNLDGKPVITATQMLDSMQWDPRPTRAEASDVANAILDGTDAIMLSGETAAGEFPVESVKMMNVIAHKTETALDHELLLKNRTRSVSMTITDAISQSVTHTAANLGVSAIITPTQSGHSARMISKYRPKAPIIAVTFSQNVYRRLSLVWGVYPVLSDQVYTTDELLDTAVNKGLETNLFSRGSKVIITAGVPVGVSGTTNLMKVHVIGNVIATGQGIGRHYAYGKAVVTNDAKEAIEKMQEGNILVTTATDKDMMPAIKKASGIVTEEGGLTSHAAVVGLNLGIPVIVGVHNLFETVKDGENITIDGGTGNIHQGHASVL
ncbi:pyruvate kinase [Pseudogracilibacillus auburnensis]|uniref:pyruvate kinase n=1 Tax=Pseudogracilibacillus auburnensis TaxID=1494959 RepID=UPI001A97AFFE|nr:pyruvate kinase [Pseudogracilibacillus auburnensis]MBO1003397.1 pyruvate kinase [Pseudogracilibacillus auburnensis]